MHSDSSTSVSTWILGMISRDYAYFLISATVIDKFKVYVKNAI